MEAKRGVIKGFDSGTYKATVQMAGSLSVWLEGVPVSRGIPSAEMVTGRSCSVIFFDDQTSPADAVLIAAWE